LLAAQRVHSLDCAADRGCDIGVRHHGEIGFGEELEAATKRMRGKFVEVERVVDRSEVVVEESTVGPCGQCGEFLS